MCRGCFFYTSAVYNIKAKEKIMETANRKTDIRIIKTLPAPKINYHMMVMPYRIYDKICGIRPLRFQLTQNDVANKIRYINDQRLLPKLEIIRYPYPKTLKSNLYIPKMVLSFLWT